MYTVRLWNNDGSAPLATFADVTVRKWSTRVNGPGRFSFALPADSPNVAYLQKWRQITLERRNDAGDDVGEWIGWTESHKRVSEAEYEVQCAGTLQIFRKRKTAKDEVFNGQGSAEMFALLADANLVDDTGIGEGTGGVTSTKDVKAQGRWDVLTTLEKAAQAHGAEFAVRFAIEDLALSSALDFVPFLGSDKSASVTLRFREDGHPRNNVEGLEEGEDGAPMANRIIGTSTALGGLTYTWDDPENQTPNGLAYPVLVEEKAFNEAQDLATLTAMTTAYGQQRANPVTDYQVLPIIGERRTSTLTGERVTVGLAYGDLVPGDLVTCDFVRRSGELQAVRRVAEVLVDVDDRGAETLRYTLTKAGVFVTANYLNGDVTGDLTRRIQNVESLLA